MQHVVNDLWHLASKHAMQDHAVCEMWAGCDAGDGFGPADARDARRRGPHDDAHRGCTVGALAGRAPLARSPRGLFLP